MESKNKKIIALLPVKNESWILETFLFSIKNITDEVIAIDDNSNDNSKEILRNYGAKIINAPNTKKINMSEKRRLLLNEGRKQRGTHFIWLDADEIFSENFLKNGRKNILDLKPGEKILMRWVHLWKSFDKFIDDKKSPFGHVWKDFIVCDDGKINFEDKLLSENRTPGDNSKIIKLPEESGVVIHFQFGDWNKVEYKQAWYRCVEFLEQNHNPKKINNTYSITFDKNFKTSNLPAKWRSGILFPKKSTPSWHREEILKMFDKKGVKFFEPLEIWHIGELHKIFVEKFGQEPKPKKFPNWLIKLNNIKNKMKNVL